MFAMLLVILLLLLHNSRDAGTAAGQWGGENLRPMDTYKKQKNHHQLCLLLLNNNVDLKNNKRNCRKICFN